MPLADPMELVRRFSSPPHEHAWRSLRLADMVCERFGLAAVTSIQNEYVAEGVLADPVPCAIHVYDPWDGIETFGTRLGGRPARDPDSPWPTSPETGLPLQFVAQLDFREHGERGASIFGDGFLSVYAENTLGYDDMNLQFEWPQRDRCRLTAANELPHGLEVIAGAQAVAYAGRDFLRLTDPNRIPPSDVRWIKTLAGTKIGGLDPTPSPLEFFNFGKPAHDHALPGEFLASIGTVAIPNYSQFPFAGEWRPGLSLDHPKYLSFCTGWMVALYLSPDGTVHWQPVLG